MTQSSSHRPFLLALAFLVALAILSLLSQWPHGHTSADAPASDFSAARAVSSLELVLAAAAGSHPVGSAANARVHEVIIDQLEAAGWQVERQRGVGCRQMRSCSAVENLIARLPGRGDGPAVLVACHTDSVPAGPGAGDDGSGMAAMLEMARNLAAGPPLARPVWLLFDEGEEMGLLGAELFVREMQPGTIGAVVNLEARGTEGPVWMFETSDGGGELVAAYGRSVKRPSTSSIAYSVYKRMPNDTDLTVFREAGLPGLGLAFIDGGARYHTARDDLDHLSTATVERMGQSALAVVRDLASRDLPLAEKEAVFFDIAALFTIHWPASWSLPIALIALLLVVLVARQTAPRSASFGREIAVGAALWPLTLVAALLGGAVVYFSLDLIGALPTPFPANMPAATVAAALAGLAMALLTARVLTITPRARLFGCLAALSTVAALTGFFEPATCYPFLLAALLGAAVSFISPRAGALVSASVLLLTLVPLVRMLPVGVGPLGLIGSATLAGLIVTPILALLPVKARFAPFMMAAALLLSMAGLLPATTEDTPRALAIQAQIEISASGERSSHALFMSSKPLPKEVVAAAGSLVDIPYGRSTLKAATIEDFDGQAIEARLLERTSERLRLHLRSPQASWAIVLRLPEGTRLTAVAWPGLEQVRGESSSSWIRLHAIPAEGVEIELAGELEGELQIIDSALGLPRQASHLAAARPPSVVTGRNGDRTEVISRLDLATLVVAAGEEANEER